MMLSIFKSKELKDFEKAMDFLDCSRTLMGSAIETHRTIDEHRNDGLVEVLALAAVVKPADDFLKKNLDTITRKIEEWKLYMQVSEPERYSKIERIVSNAEKNIRVAREKAIHIDHWMRFERVKISPF